MNSWDFALNDLVKKNPGINRDFLLAFTDAWLGKWRAPGFTHDFYGTGRGAYARHGEAVVLTVDTTKVHASFHDESVKDVEQGFGRIVKGIGDVCGVFGAEIIENVRDHGVGRLAVPYSQVALFDLQQVAGATFAERCVDFWDRDIANGFCGSMSRVLNASRDEVFATQGDNGVFELIATAVRRGYGVASAIDSRRLLMVSGPKVV